MTEDLAAALLRETERAVRDVLPDESPIDLDQHAHQIAVVVVRARGGDLLGLDAATETA